MRGQSAVRVVQQNGEQRRSARLAPNKGAFSVDGKFCMLPLNEVPDIC